jgi:oxepin-CoA hydrolase/3-oxo-5,6-dehydrosuberyl-CoA semialdehyde dehydrogenase
VGDAHGFQLGVSLDHGSTKLPFVSAAPGPVLANYGLDTLRFINPVGIGDTIQARLTCKRKIDQGKKSPQGIAQGVVAWDVEVTNQLGDLVASYGILTLVVKREEVA